MSLRPERGGSLQGVALSRASRMSKLRSESFVRKPDSMSRRSDSPSEIVELPFVLDGDQIEAYEVYFSIKVDRFPLDDSEWTPLERRSVLDHRWWTIDELRNTHEKVYPEWLLEWVGHDN